MSCHERENSGLDFFVNVTEFLVSTLVSSVSINHLYKPLVRL